jgi:phage host-nuclease inhibitor protein Gam
MQTDEEQEALPETAEDLRGWMAGAARADVEAQAGWWLRSLAFVTDDLTRVDEREEAEVARIRAHYARIRNPLRDRAAALERSLEALAAELTFDGRKKSLALTYGTLGRRTQPARVAVIDKDAALAWARKVGCVRVTEAVDVKTAAPTVLALVAETGEVPDGWEYVAEHETAYVKTNSAAASGVA